MLQCLSLYPNGIDIIMYAICPLYIIIVKLDVTFSMLIFFYISQICGYNSAPLSEPHYCAANELMSSGNPISMPFRCYIRAWPAYSWVGLWWDLSLRYFTNADFNDVKSIMVCLIVQGYTDDRDTLMSHLSNSLT